MPRVYEPTKSALLADGLRKAWTHFTDAIIVVFDVTTN